MARTPWPTATAFSSSIPCSRDQMRHCRSTEWVESTSTPSRSKRIAAQLNLVILFFYHKDGRLACRCRENFRRLWRQRYRLSLLPKLQMTLAEVGLGTLTPGVHEPVVEARAEGGAHEWNHASRPLLHHLSAGPRRDALNHARNELVDHFFLQQFTADVDPGCAGGSDPKFGDFMVGVELKSVDQTQLLDGAHGDGRQNAEIGKDGDQAAEAKARPLKRRKFHAAANHFVGHNVEFAHIKRIHTVITADR